MTNSPEEIGKRHFRAGRKLSDNPYPCGKEARKWDYGWYQERAKWLLEVGGREL